MTNFDFKEIATLDKQIATLMSCKPLAENEVHALCEKVRLGTLIPRPRKSCLKNQM